MHPLLLSGDKAFYPLTSRRLADELQCAVAVVGYDLYPIADGAEQVAQVDAAFQWAEAGAPIGRGRRLLAEGAELLVVGHSAGGHLSAAAMLARQDKPSGTVGTLSALALLSAPLELRRHVAHEAMRGVATISALSAAFVADDGRAYQEGDDASPSNGLRLYDDSQPLASLSPEHQLHEGGAAALRKLPPRVALYHGDADPVVPVASSRRFEDALRDASAVAGGHAPPAVVARYPSCGHLDYVLELITSEEQPALVTFLREALSL